MPTGASQPGAAQATPARGGAAVPHEHEHDRQLTITIPVDRVADAVTGSVIQAGRVLSARGGLPLYVGLGVLAAADVIAWPAAAAAGLGYAVLRRWGPFGPPARPPWEREPAAAGRAGEGAPAAEAPARQPGAPARAHKAGTGTQGRTGT